MKKFLRFSLVALFAVLGMSNAMAEDTDVVFTLNDPDAITALGITLPDAGQGTTVESMSNGEVTITCTSGSTATRIYQGSGKNEGKYDFRIYKDGGTLTFTAGSNYVKKIVITGNNLGNLSGDDYSAGTWTGSEKSVTLTATGTATIYTITVTYGEDSGDDPTPQDVDLYTEPFTSNEGKFTINDVTLPSGLSYVWSFSNNYGAKASAYVSNTYYETESWLISPVIDLTNATNTKIYFSHAINKFVDIATAKEQAVVLVKVGDGDWTVLAGVVYPEEQGWTFVENTIDVSSIFDGNKVQVAFKYTSSSESAGTWEIKPFTIKGKGEAVVEEPAAPDPSHVLANIGELLALDATEDVELTLGDDAQVLFVNNNNIYIRDNTGAFCLYKSGISVTANQMISGKIRGDLSYYGNSGVTMPELEPNKYAELDKLTISDGEEAQPAATASIDELADYMCDLVKLENVKAIVKTEGSTNTYYLTDGTDEVIATNLAGLKSHVDAADDINVIALVAVSSNKLRLYPISIETIDTGISALTIDTDVNAPMYNLKGERVDANYRGVVIKGGKKTIQK